MAGDHHIPVQIQEYGQVGSPWRRWTAKNDRIRKSPTTRAMTLKTSGVELGIQG